MRFNIIHDRLDTVVGQTDHLDIAYSVLGDPLGGSQFIVVDTWTGVAVDRPVNQPARGILSPEQLPYNTIDQLIRGSQKIMAIKLIRELAQIGLGEAKQLADLRESAMKEQALVDDEQDRA